MNLKLLQVTCPL